MKTETPIIYTDQIEAFTQQLLSAGYTDDEAAEAFADEVHRYACIYGVVMVENPNGGYTVISRKPAQC